MLAFFHREDKMKMTRKLRCKADCKILDTQCGIDIEIGNGGNESFREKQKPTIVDIQIGSFSESRRLRT